MSNADSIPTLTSVAALATYLKEKKGYDLFGNAPPINVEIVPELLGINVDEGMRYSLDDVSTVGQITLVKGQPATIWINPTENSYAPRRRFTLAHEIAHFCMHRAANQTFVDTKSTMNRTASYWNRYESEANNFAADLLMPSELIHRVGRKVIDAYKSANSVEKMPMARFVEEMALKFKVSTPAMEFRLKNLGIRGSKSPTPA